MIPTGINLAVSSSVFLSRQGEQLYTYIAVEITAKTQRGILEKIDATVMKLVQTVYIVGAIALGVVRAMRTKRNFPNPPLGARIAANSPPTFPVPPRPSSQDGT